MNDAHATAVVFSSWDELPLGPGGRSLIQASAGTGKTWTIAALYLRLLLEEERQPPEIIVTTFTDLAAQELRERIRSRIGEALRWAEEAAGGSGEEANRQEQVAGEGCPGAQADPVRTWLAARWDGAEGAARRRLDRNRLKLALVELDRAPIGTLHQLCRRILADFPFDCGSAFRAGELIDGASLVRELVDDMKRMLGQGEGELSPEDQKLWAERAKLPKLVKELLAPGVVVRTISDGETEALFDPQAADRLRAWLSEAMFKKKNGKLPTRMQALLEYIDAGGAADGEVLKKLADLREVVRRPPEMDLRPESLEREDTAAVLAWADSAVDWIDKLESKPLMDALAAWQERLREWARVRLADRGQASFDALIETVHDALLGDGGSLAEKLSKAWPVALVDEFQDTDGLQYAILDRIYRAGGTLRGRLVMIGDPKQAIYRFRGGDIHAYLGASVTATDTLRLGTNHRSSPALLAGFNEFFEEAGSVLSSKRGHEIRYEPVAAPAGRDNRYCLAGEPVVQALEIHYWPDPPDAAPERTEAALQACANHIVALLGTGYAIEGKPLEPRNLAVLVPKNKHLTRLRELLDARGVPCVSASRTSVFGSTWVRELRIALHAVLHHRDEGAVCAALAGAFCGQGWEDLLRLAEDAEAWQEIAGRFEALDRLWQARGVLAVVQRLAHDAGPLLLGRPDAERALTDLRHLGELLQQQAEQAPGRAELLAWLAEAAGDGVDGEDAASERQLRLESEAARVTLMTIHASKGLEFDVVLLPLMWHNTAHPHDAFVTVHDDMSGGRVLSVDPEALARHEQEDQDERFRLLYVAMTRARHACHVYALPPHRAQNAKSKEPLADPKRAPLDVLLERLLAEGQPACSLQHVAWHAGAWDWPEARWAGAPAEAAAERTALAPPPDAAWEGLYSYSALTRGASLELLEEGAAGDEEEPAAPLPGEAGRAAAVASEPQPAGAAPHAALAMLADVGGVHFGNAVHAIFELREHGVPMAAQGELIGRCLAAEGVRSPSLAPEELVARLAERLQQVLDAPLLPGSDLSLGALPAAAQRAEMEFDFVLDDVSLARLRAASPLVPPGRSGILRGFMNGKIDLVFEHAGRFHVLDYKTNRSGKGLALADYAPAGLDRVMAEHHYPFQALLYTVALDRYLRARLPGYRRERHLGEAIYLFVRAVGIAPGAMPEAGVWTHRFDPASIEAVDRALAGAAGREEPA